MSKKSEVKNIFCPEGCGNILTANVGVCFPAWEFAVCMQCDAVSVSILDHKCHWIPHDRKCKKNKLGWFCYIGSHSIVCPAEFDPNSTNTFPKLPEEIQKTDLIILPYRWLEQKSDEWKKKYPTQNEKHK